MQYKKGRYSGYMRPLFTIIDLGIIIFSLFLYQLNVNNYFILIIYLCFTWVVISVYNRFYDIHRYTRIVRVVALLVIQIILFLFVLYAFIGFFKQTNISRLALGNYVLTVSLIITLIKFTVYFLLKKYRAELGGNRRNIIVIGKNE